MTTVVHVCRHNKPYRFSEALEAYYQELHVWMYTSKSKDAKRMRRTLRRDRRRQKKDPVLKQIWDRSRFWHDCNTNDCWCEK